MRGVARTDILERKDEIESWIAESRSKAFICAQVGCKPVTLDTALKRLGIVYKGNQGAKGFKPAPNLKPVESYLVRGSHIQTHKLKLKILDAGLRDARCVGCGLAHWRGEPIPLELHHKDGVRTNNLLDNLELLCPNCHALTPNFCGRALRARKVEPAA